MVFGIANDLIFENGALSRIGEIIEQRFGAKKILIVCGKSLFRSGKGEEMVRSLEMHAIAWEKFDEVPQDPTDTSMDSAAKAYGGIGIELILAVGGGSVMDFSKSLACCMTNGCSVHALEGATGVKNAPVKLVAVPTTAGTGSEVTSVSIVTFTDQVRKAVIGGPWIRASLAVCDPTLLLSLPKHLTAYTGMDALTHAIEAYTSRLSSPISDMFALEAIRLISENLLKAYQNPDSLEYREKMLLGSLLAGYSFDNALLGMVHAMAHPIGAHFHVQHGAANAITLAESVRFNSAVVPEKTIKIAVAMGVSPEKATLESAAEKIDELAAALSIPSLKETGIKPEDFDMLAAEALKEGCMPCNPRECSKKDIVEIYQKLYK